MHEVGLMEQALEIVSEHARRAGAARVRTVRLLVGDLSGVVPDALEFAFEIVKQDTVAENARLEITTEPVVCFCLACTHEWTPSDPIYVCPGCGQPGGEIRAGRDFRVASIEVD